MSEIICDVSETPGHHCQEEATYTMRFKNRVVHFCKKHYLRYKQLYGEPNRSR
jgi:hypothetical protein